MFAGVTISLTSVILADIVGIDKLSNAFGMCNFVGGVSVFAGPPVAGKRIPSQTCHNRRALILRTF
ncbi:hypothetical protein DPMN_136451 [Dreissena polymorpha]|uniref:Major facilitator superfamily (MFS) profile domain-containing protein n=1 Tax=Dreissena polymorpha TaxID=45954 RepID=A0A9D4JCP1_DREPO|nr:hypothetical protein DPMN_136451 [Dreissena polymorpha]